MTLAEIDKALNSMIYLVDSREQPTQKAKNRWETLGNYERIKLDFGDYSAKVITDCGEFNLSDTVVIERKMSLDEIVGNFCERERSSPDVVAWNLNHSDKIRNRFEYEFIRAKQKGARVYLLIEGASWEAILAHRYKSRFSPKALIASLMAFQSRYDLRIMFCKAEVTGTLISNILKYEMRERLINMAEGG